jgi:hypothetical protein
MESINERVFEGIRRRCLESNYWCINSLEEYVKVCSSKGRKEE